MDGEDVHNDQKNSRLGYEVTASKTEVIALFSAVAVYLSSIEYVLPRPVPFFRFGLANIAVLLVIRRFRFRDALALVLLKVLGLGILNGTIVSYVFVFSFVGSMGSLCAMKLCTLISEEKISLIGISIIGAFVSNLLQFGCALFILFGTQAWVIAPYLLSMGLFSGAIVGICAQYYGKKSKIITILIECYKREKKTSAGMVSHTNSFSRDDHVLQRSALLLLFCAVITILPYALTRGLVPRVIQTTSFYICATRVKKVKLLYFLSLMGTVTFFSLIVPRGKVLFHVGTFPLTDRALFEGLYRALTLCGYVFLSLWCIRSDLRIPGKVGRVFSLMLHYFHHLWSREKEKNTHKQRGIRESIAIFARADAVLHSAVHRDRARSIPQRPIPWGAVVMCVGISYATYFFWG